MHVFLDCSSCDENYMRTEVTFINFVRDRVGADVHVLITTQGTGGGGTEFTLKFIGLGRFQGIDHTLTYVSAANGDARTKSVRGSRRSSSSGLVRYVADSPLAPRLTVTFEEPAGQQTAAAPWMTRGTSGCSGSARAAISRVRNPPRAGGWRPPSPPTARRRTWKINFNGSRNYEQETFDLEEEDGTFTSVRRQSEFRALVTKSINDHWSYGGTAVSLTSTFQNYDLRTRTAPGIEYNIFPYSESTRRILTLFYSVGFQTADYTEETIFGKISEKLLDHSFEVSMALRQPWGTASGSLEVQQYLNRSDTYRVNAFGSARCPPVQRLLARGLRIRRPAA